MFDSKGASYIIDQDNLIVTEQGVKLKTFDVNNLYTNVKNQAY